MRNPQCASNESGLVLRELFDPRSSGGPFLGHCQSFNEHSYYRLDNAVSAMEVLPTPRFYSVTLSEACFPIVNWPFLFFTKVI